MNRIGKMITSLWTLAIPLHLSAHEGHGHGAGHELTHYWLSPEHIIPVALVLALLVAFMLFRYRSRKQETGKEPVKRN